MLVQVRLGNHLSSQVPSTLRPPQPVCIPVQFVALSPFTSSSESVRQCYLSPSSCSEAGIVGVGVNVCSSDATRQNSSEEAWSECPLPPNASMTYGGNSRSGALAYSSGVGASNQSVGPGSIMSDPESGMAKKTLLVAYFPRSAAEHDLEKAFARGGIGARVSVKIVRDGAVSRCFGFVRFPTCALAREAFDACQDGRIVMKDADGKSWYIKASWARVEQKDRRRTS